MQLNLDDSAIFPIEKADAVMSRSSTGPSSSKNTTKKSAYRHEIEYFIDHGTDSTTSSAAQLATPSASAFSLCRVDFIGRGSSASVFKSVLLNTPYVKLCAEKVVAAGNPSKRIQLIRELESLKFSLISSKAGQSSFTIYSSHFHSHSSIFN
jgi:hypothetical protein